MSYNLHTRSSISQLCVSRQRAAPARSVITHFASSSITAIVKSDRMFGSGGIRVHVCLDSCVCARVTVWCPHCPPVFVLCGSAGRTESSVPPYIIPPSVKRNNAALRYQTWRPCHVDVCVCARTHLHCVFVQLCVWMSCPFFPVLPAVVWQVDLIRHGVMGRTIFYSCKDINTIPCFFSRSQHFRQGTFKRDSSSLKKKSIVYSPSCPSELICSWAVNYFFSSKNKQQNWPKTFE